MVCDYPKNFPLFMSTSRALITTSTVKNDKIYHDNVASEINSVPDSAPHRPIDLAIIKAQKELGNKAKIAIMIPPTILNSIVPKFYMNRALWEAREYPSRIYGWIAFCTANVVCEIPAAIVR